MSGVSPTDLKYYLTGAATDGGVQADPADSLGGHRSGNEIASGVLENLFANVTSPQASAGATHYRCVAIKNASAETLYNAKAYIYAQVDPNSDQTIHFALERPESDDATDGDAQTVANEDTAPAVDTTDHNGTGSGVSDWVAPTTFGDAEFVDVGAFNQNLAPGEIIFVWFRRVIDEGSQPQSNMSFTIRLTGDTV